MLSRSATRKRAIDRAVAFVTERLNGEDGLGAIFPAMANSVMMYDVLGYPPDHPQRVMARGSLEKLLVVKRGRSLLPALRLAGLGHRAHLPYACSRSAASAAVARVKPGLEWLRPLQVLDVHGDWARSGPMCAPAAGRSNMPIRITPTSTIPPSW